MVLLFSTHKRVGISPNLTCSVPRSLKSRRFNFPCKSKHCLIELFEFFTFRDLSEQNDLEGAILECFLSPSNEVKSAASFALGRPLKASSSKILF